MVTLKHTKKDPILGKLVRYLFVFFAYISEVTFWMYKEVFEVLLKCYLGSQQIPTILSNNFDYDNFLDV